GGFHPIHIGDSIGPDGRFRIMNKMGSGGSGTVWLCEDTQHEVGKPKWRAVKISKARCGTTGAVELKIKNIFIDHGVAPWSAFHHGVAIPIDSFSIDGPNGTHMCLVLPVLGPKIHRNFALFTDTELKRRSVCLNIAQAMKYIHSLGICHG
ncbi:hypothetical protein B0T26DRAFT_596610, partial [Lasiosphaeria miniovina]